MISWEEYIRSQISDFRETYKDLPKDYREFLEVDKEASVASLMKPSQVVVIVFSKPHPTHFIILHTEDYSDKEVIVYENVKFEDFFRKLSKENHKLHQILGDEAIKYIIDKSRKMVGFKGRVDWRPFAESFVINEIGVIRSGWELAEILHLFIERRLDIEKRERQRKKIEETVKDIKEDASAIEETELRARIIEKTEGLEGQVKQLGEQHRKLREEVVGVRKLIGTTKEFQEFRAFTTELEELKRTHIHREVFLTETKRLDEKIEKGLEALNTRIEDLKAIKFWSKRTLLEIALAILAIIATLFAAGILKF